MRGGIHLALGVLAVLGSLSVFPAQGAPASKVVNVQLRAKWKGTPLLLEASEFLEKEDPKLFWELVDRWHDVDKPSEAASDKECVDKILETAQSVGGRHLAGLLHLSLSLRTQSARLVLHRQLARESVLLRQPAPANQTSDRWQMSDEPVGPGGACCWVDVGTSELLTAVEDVSAWIEKARRG